MTDLELGSKGLPQRMKVTMGVFEADTTCFTTHVARNAVVLDYNPKVPKGEMVWLNIDLPEGRKVEATATMRGPAPSPLDGWLAEFSMFMRGSRSLWDDFLNSLQWEGAKEGGGRERRVFQRFEGSSFVLRCRDREWVSSNISSGGVFVPSRILLPEGAEVQVDLVHPGSGETFSVTARVARLVYGHGGGERGMGLEFLGLDDDRRKALERFFTEGTELRQLQD